MRVESHNQKFNNGCTKGSTKRVDVHIFYEFYTHTDSGNGFVLYQTDAHAAGRQTDGQRDRLAGSIPLAAEKGGAKEKRRGT